MTTKKRLGELLIEAGVIDDHQLIAALGHQRQWGVKLGQALVDLKIATELQIVDALSKKLGFEAVRLDRIEPSPVLEAALKLVPRDLARSQNLIPLAADTSSVTLAMSDPTNVAIVDEIAFRTGKRVRIVIAGDREIARSIRKLYFPEETLRPVALDDTAMAAEDLVTTSDWFAEMPQSVAGKGGGDRGIEVDEEPPPAAHHAPNAAVNRAGAPTRAATPAPGRAEPAEARARPAVPAASEAVLIDVIERMLRGERAPGGLEPGRLVAASVRLLLRKGAFSEAELLAELMRK